MMYFFDLTVGFIINIIAHIITLFYFILNNRGQQSSVYAPIHTDFSCEAIFYFNLETFYISVYIQCCAFGQTESRVLTRALWNYLFNASKACGLPPNLFLLSLQWNIPGGFHLISVSPPFSQTVWYQGPAAIQWAPSPALHERHCCHDIRGVTHRARPSAALQSLQPNRS